MKNRDIETRGRPRNDNFTEFCDLLEADFEWSEMKSAKPGDTFTVYGRLLSGTRKVYLNFRNSVSMNALKKRLDDAGFKASIYFQGGLVYLKAVKK